MAHVPGMSCRRLYAAIAKRAPVKMSAAEVLAFLRIVKEVIAKNVRPQNVVRIPQLTTFRIRFNNPRPNALGALARETSSLLPRSPSQALDAVHQAA